MQKYVGLNLVDAIPQFNTMSDHEGYKLVYENGKTGWETKEVFEQAFEPIENGMDFGIALKLLKKGYKLKRKGWNDKGLFLSLTLPNNEHVLFNEKSEVVETSIPFIAMISIDNSLVPWEAPQADLLAEDWVIISE